MRSLSRAIVVASGGRTQRALQTTRPASPQTCTYNRPLHRRAKTEYVRGGAAASANEGVANIGWRKGVRVRGEGRQGVYSAVTVVCVRTGKVTCMHSCRIQFYYTAIGGGMQCITA